MNMFRCTPIALAIATISSISNADNVTYSARLENGAAFAVTPLQTSRFGVGVATTFKPSVGLTSWLDISPVFSALALPSRIDGVEAGTAVGTGGGFRLKMPHTDAASTFFPWVDCDLQYVRTGALDRAMFSAGVGVSTALGSERMFWVGPFVRYLDITQEQRLGFNSADAHVLVIGASMEFGTATSIPPYVPEPTPPQVYEQPVPPKIVVKKQPQPPVVERKVNKEPVQRLELIEVLHTVQFPYDSYVPTDASQSVLKETLEILLNHKGYNIEVRGYASSEGTPEHNEKLALRRAQTVTDYLVTHGVPKNLLETKGYGTRNPVSQNKVLNRRVEVKLDIFVPFKNASNVK